MKTIIPLLFLVLSSVTSSVIAQTPALYPIGSPDQPVVLGEYCTFLTDSKAVQSETSLQSIEEDFLGAANSLITHTGEPGKYQFLVSMADVNQVMNAVPSEQAQQLFNAWRENPTVKELCSYANDQVHIQLKFGSPSGISPWSHTAYTEDAVSIMSSYPYSVTLPLADLMVRDYYTGKVFSFVNERGLIVFTITRAQLISLESSFTGYEKTVNYHRPTLITKNGVPLQN